MNQDQKNQYWQCVLYIRVSSEEQMKGFSPENQVDELNRYAKNHRPPLKVVKIFEEAKSGWKLKARTEFYKMLEYIVENKIEHILALFADRLSRNMEDYIELKNAGIALKDAGINLTLHFARGRPVSFSDPEGFEEIFRLITDIAYAEKDSAIKSYRVRLGMKKKAEKGEYPKEGPLGYWNPPGAKKIMPDPERFDKVKRLFKLFLRGDHSIGSLVKVAESVGLKSRKGNLLKKATIDDMLKNPFYYGHFRWGGKLHSNRGINNDQPPSYPPMITKLEFDEIQNILSGRRNNWTTKRGRDWLFKGVITCGKCQRTFLAESKPVVLKSGEKKEVIYYHCSRCKKQDMPWLTETEIERIILDNVNNMFPDEETMNKLIEDLGEEVQIHRDLAKDEMVHLRKRRTETEIMIDRLWEMRLNPDANISDKDFQSRLEKLKEERERATERLRLLEDTSDASIDEAAEFIEVANSFKEKYLAADMKTRNRMMKLMYRTIFLNKPVREYIYNAYPQFIYNEPFETLFQKGLLEKSRELDEQGYPPRLGIESKHPWPDSNRRHTD